MTEGNVLLGVVALAGVTGAGRGVAGVVAVDTPAATNADDAPTLLNGRGVDATDVTTILPFGVAVVAVDGVVAPARGVVDAVAVDGVVEVGVLFPPPDASVGVMDNGRVNDGTFTAIPDPLLVPPAAAVGVTAARGVVGVAAAGDVAARGVVGAIIPSIVHKSTKMMMITAHGKA